MRQVTRTGLITVAAASGMLAVTGGYAHADAGAAGSAFDSPGVASGNTVQVPVQVPVNVCGNTVDVVGLLNPAAGNTCANGAGEGHRHGHEKGHAHEKGHGSEAGHRTQGDHSSHDADAQSGSGGAHAEGSADGSPGVISGNTVQVPVDVPVNVCGNSVDVVGALNPAAGNDCANNVGTPDRPAEEPPAKPEPRPAEPKAPAPQTAEEPQQLAQTGASLSGAAVPLAAGALIAGAALYRRSRSAA